MIIGKKFPSMQNEKREIDSSRRRGKIFNRLVERRSHLLAPSPPFFPLSPRHARPYLTLIPQQPPGRRLIPYHPLIPLRL